MAGQQAGVSARRVVTDPVCRAAVVAAVCWLAGYAALTAGAQGSPAMMLFVGDILYLVPIVASMLAAGLAARRLAGRQRRMWRMLAVANAAQLTGEIVWAGYDYLAHDGPPQPSIADAGYLTSSAVTLLAIVVGFGGVAGLRRLRGMLDTGLILIALGAPGWQMLLRPQLSGQVTVAELVNVAYPILDVAVLSCLGILGLGGHGRLPLGVRLVGVAAAVNAASDMTYTYQSLFSQYLSGGWLDLMFEAGAVTAFLGAVLAMRLREPPTEPQQFDSGLTVLPLFTATAATFTLIIFDKLTAGTVDNFTLIVVGTLFLTVLLRQHLFVTDRAALARQLRQALGQQRRLAVTDGLTGLYNRRHLTEQMAELEAGGGPVSLLVVDLDHFKRVNDTFGHVTGDAVLCEAAARITAVCRSTDVVARYGGEEFVVLLPDTDQSEAVRLGERIRTVLRESPVVDSAGPIPISASVGVATRHGGDMRRLMAAADRALYEAKERGRDRVAVAGEPGTGCLAPAGSL